jgi:tetratricopeptide (TPR) repeat protein
MDLLDFDKTELYFDDPITPEVEQLIAGAAGSYGSEDAEAEAQLLKAYALAPQHLAVLVALYRYYFYQHRLEDALMVGESALAVAGQRLAFPESWVHLQIDNVGEGVMRSMGLVRFYLMVLKATGYVNLRLGNYAEGQAMLEKLVEMDSHDRLGGKALLEVIRTESATNYGVMERSK